MIWSKSRASTVNHGENVSTNIVDVMHSAQLANVVNVVQSEATQPEVHSVLPSLVHRSHLQLLGSESLQSLLLAEVCQKSSINEAYYNLDKVLSWRVSTVSTFSAKREEEKAIAEAVAEEKTES